MLYGNHLRWMYEYQICQQKSQHWFSIGSGTKTTHQRIFLELMLTNHDAFSRHSSRISVTMS